jgi:signal transduction histidine kinase
MLSRLGLRSRMAVSYVLVSAAAVLVVEAVAIAIMVPRILAARASLEQAQQRVVEAEAEAVRFKAERLAVETAAGIGEEANRIAASIPGRSDADLLATVADGGRLAKGVDPHRDLKANPVLLLALTTVDGRVIGSTAESELPLGVVVTETVGSPPTRSGRTAVDGRAGGWATSPVRLTDAAGTERAIGAAYVRMLVQRTESGSSRDKPVVAGKADDPPVDKPDAAAGDPADGNAAGTGVSGLLVPGGIVLLMLVPVGALFGLLTTGPLIRRIRRLAEGTSAMAGGDLRTRLPVSGNDEVARLERSFNAMAERLEAAVATERTVAGAQARRAERTRIARELHDSISQDLFSASMVAGGLRKALPADSELRHQAVSLEQSLERTKREMRSMLLELRPVALEDTGLAEALHELCRAYQVRLGIAITAHVDAAGLDASLEHAVLRVVQEAIGNAVRHGEPTAIELRVTRTDERVAVTVRDDGRGFDPVAARRRHGMGLGLMRDRVGELGGTVEVVSAPEQGTTVRVLVPVGTA